MKILHTGDWHVGKVLRGRSRHEEHEAVLAEIVAVSDRERVDIVVVAGDLFESSAPAAAAQALVWDTLLALKETGAEVIVIAGNHDDAASFDALRPLAAAAGLRVLGRAVRPDEGGTFELVVRSNESARIALLPFVSQRSIVKADLLMSGDAAQATQTYDDRLRRLIGVLTASFDSDAVNLVLAHGTVRGGKLGGGERDAQTVFDYQVGAHAFPPSASYVALGHLHRCQSLPAGCPVWYAGSPLAVDFGEEADTKGVVLVDVEAAKPARAHQVPIAAARELRTLRGRFDELTTLDPGDALLRVVLTEPTRAGLADDVRTRFPNALDVRIDNPDLPEPVAHEQRRLTGRSPRALFDAFLADGGIDDVRLGTLFDELNDQITGGRP
jgi:exonuclease SbcD